MSRICASFSLRSSARVYEAWITGPSAIGSLYGIPNSHRVAPRADSSAQHVGREFQIGIAGRDERHKGLAAGGTQLLKVSSIADIETG